MRFLLLWLINTAALFVLPYLMSSITISSFESTVVGALILGLINALIRPVLLLLTLPISVVTMGLFALVLNGLLFWLSSRIVPGFHVAGFWSAMGGSLLYSIIVWSLSTLLIKE